MTNIAKVPATDTTVGYIAGEIRAHAARRGLSGRQLAMRLGKSQPWMSRRLTGEVPLDVEELSTIADFLGVHPGAFFPGHTGPDQTPAGLSLSDAEERVILALRASDLRTLVPKVAGSIPVGGTVIPFPARSRVSEERAQVAPVTAIRAAVAAS